MGVPSPGRSKFSVYCPLVTWNFNADELVAEAPTVPCDTDEVSIAAPLPVCAAALLNVVDEMALWGVNAAPVAWSDESQPPNRLKRPRRQSLRPCGKLYMREAPSYEKV